jgi:hypothetical protein
VRPLKVVLMEIPPMNVISDSGSMYNVERRTMPRLRLWNAVYRQQWLGYGSDQDKRSREAEQTARFSPLDNDLFHSGPSVDDVRCVVRDPRFLKFLGNPFWGRHDQYLT